MKVKERIWLGMRCWLETLPPSYLIDLVQGLLLTQDDLIQMADEIESSADSSWQQRAMKLMSMLGIGMYRWMAMDRDNPPPFLPLELYWYHHHVEDASYMVAYVPAAFYDGDTFWISKVKEGKPYRENIPIEQVIAWRIITMPSVPDDLCAAWMAKRGQTRETVASMINLLWKDS